MIRRREPRGPTIAYWLITVSSWCALNGLAALGLVVLLFILFANASFEGFFREGGNLAAHYLTAAPAARVTFQHLVGWHFAGTFVVLAAIRIRALVAGLLPQAATGSSDSTASAI